MSVKALLDEEIQKELEKLEGMEAGTEAYKAMVDGVAKLMAQSIEIDKSNADMEERIKARESEYDLKIQELTEDKKDRLIKNIINVAGIVIPVGVTIWGTLASFKFEQEGTITTIMGRGFINKLLPKK